MGATDLVAEGLVDLRGIPADRLEELEEVGLGHADALAHQGLRIGRHQGARLVSVGVDVCSLTEVAAVGAGLDRAAQEAVAGPAQLAIDQDPEPIVSEAIASLTSRRVSEVSRLRRSIVVSTRERLLSVPTTTPARICPSSIMLAT